MAYLAPSENQIVYFCAAVYKIHTTVFRFPNGRFKGRMVDALVLCGDEGRGVTAISFGEVLSNL